MEAGLNDGYYLSRVPEIEVIFDEHSRAWAPFLIAKFGDDFSQEVIANARLRLSALIPGLPYIGGDENPMTRHLITSTTSLSLYLAMKAGDKTAEEVGEVILLSVRESVAQKQNLLSAEDLHKLRVHARLSQERRYQEDWLWEFVEGDGIEFDFGYDFYECGTQKLFHRFGADEFLPYHCRLDFITFRSADWTFNRTMTIAAGDEKCDFRFKHGGSAG